MALGLLISICIRHIVPINAHVAKIKAPIDNQSEYLLLRDRGVRGVRGLFATGRYAVFSPMVFICFVIFYSRNYTWKRLFLLGLHADEAQVHVDVDPSPSKTHRHARANRPWRNRVAVRSIRICLSTHVTNHRVHQKFGLLLLFWYAIRLIKSSISKNTCRYLTLR